MEAPKPQLNAYEKLYDKKLDDENVAEMRYNLVGYFQVLIEMDRQYQEYQKQKKQKKVLIKNDNK